MNEPYRLRYANQIVGAFVLLILLVVFVLAAFLLRAQNYFVGQESYWIAIGQDELQGTRVGTEVTMLGQRVGSVKSIAYMNDNDQVRVTLGIRADRAAMIFDDSFIVQDRKFGLGTPVIDIRRGAIKGDSPSAQRSVLSPGSRIKTSAGEPDSFDKMAVEVASANDAIQKVQGQLDPTLVEIRSAATEFRDSLDQQVNPAFEQGQTAAKSLGQASAAVEKASDEVSRQVSQTLQSIDQATQELETRMVRLTERVEKLVDEDMRRTLASARQASDDVGATAKQVERTSQEVGVDIEATLKTLETAAQSVQRLAEETRQVVRIVRGEADDLPGTTARINDTVSQTQDLVEEVRGHWLLRRSRKQTSPALPISPSGVRGGYAR